MRIEVTNKTVSEVNQMLANISEHLDAGIDRIQDYVFIVY